MVEHFVDAVIASGPVPDGFVAQIDHAGGLTYHDYTLGMLGHPAFRVTASGRYRRFILPGMFTLVPTEDGDGQAIILQWARRLLRTVLIKKGVEPPTQIYHQVHGDWTLTLPRAAQDGSSRDERREREGMDE